MWVRKRARERWTKKGKKEGRKSENKGGRNERRKEITLKKGRKNECETKRK